MKKLAFLLALLPLAAQADLYRWVDPETGSVKLSNYPPPPAVAERAEIVPFRGVAAPAPEEKAAAPKPPAKPPAPPRPPVPPQPQ